MATFDELKWRPYPHNKIEYKCVRFTSGHVLYWHFNPQNGDEGGYILYEKCRDYIPGTCVCGGDVFDIACHIAALTQEVT